VNRHLTLGRMVLSLGFLALVWGTLGLSAGAEPPAMPKIGNVIRWMTSSEVDNFGYDVFRADDEQGPFKRITPMPVPGHGTTDMPHSYAFRDEAIEPGRVYYYYVESISLDGKRERFTPISRSKPKSTH